MVETLKQHFYKNLNGMLPMDDLSVFGTSMLTSSLLNDPLRNFVNLALPEANIPALHPGICVCIYKSSGIFCTNQLTNQNIVGSLLINAFKKLLFCADQTQMQLASPPYLYGVGTGSQYIPECSSMQICSPALRNSFMLRDFGSGPYGEGSSSGPSMVSGQLAADYDFQHEPSIWEANELRSAPCNQTVDTVSSDFYIRFSRNGSPRGRWCKIRAAVKWVLVMRDVAEKRMAKLYPYLDF